MGLLDSFVRFLLLVLGIFLFVFLYTTQQLALFIHFVVSTFTGLWETVNRLL